MEVAEAREMTRCPRCGHEWAPPAKLGMTKQQARLLGFIKGHIEAGFMPSFDELAAAMGLRSKSGIAGLLDGLEERGYIRRDPYRARSIVVLP